MTDEIKPTGWLIDVEPGGASHKDLKIFTPTLIEKYAQFYVDDHPNRTTAKPVYLITESQMRRMEALENIVERVNLYFECVARKWEEDMDMEEFSIMGMIEGLPPKEPKE